MASRFWVQGNGSWSDNTHHWSATSGGTPGASLPTSSDNVFIDSNSGLSGGTISMNTTFFTAACNNFTSTAGHAYVINSVTDNLKIYGSLTLETGVTMTGQMSFYFYATATGKTITSAGVTIDGFVSFRGIGGGWTLQDDLTLSGEFYQENGTFDANGHNVTAGDFYFYADIGSTPIINMGSGTWGTGNTSGEFWTIDENNGQLVTFNPGTSTIKFTQTTASSEQFNGDNGSTGNVHTYNNIWITGSGTGAIRLIGNNTFNDFKCDTPPHTIQFIHGTTTTVNTFTVSGTAGNLITLQSDSAASFTLVESGGGKISRDYLSISNSIATPGQTWYAGTHSTDGGGNSGWLFTNYQGNPATKLTQDLALHKITT